MVSLVAAKCVLAESVNVAERQEGEETVCVVALSRLEIYQHLL